MKIKGDTVTFSNGKTRSANNGIIGLAPDMEVTAGSDDGFYMGPYGEEFEGDNALDKADLKELAEYMIEQWKKFLALNG